MRADEYMTRRYAEKWITALERQGCTCKPRVPFVLNTSEGNGRGEFLSVRFLHRAGCPAFGTAITAADIGEAS